MDAIEPQEGIGATELSTFAEDPVVFFETRSFSIIEPLARQVQTLFKEAQLSWEEYKLSLEPFSEERIGRLLKQTQALLKTQTELKEQEKESQVAAYLQRRMLFQQLRTVLQKLREIEQKTTLYISLLTKLKTRLKKL